MDLESNEEYMFGDNIPGPVLVPWYKNHGLTKSQQFLKFFSDQRKLASTSKSAADHQRRASGSSINAKKKKNPWDNDWFQNQ